MKQAPLSSRGDEPSVPEHVVENLRVFQNWRPSFYRLCCFAILVAFGKRVGSGDHDRDVSQSCRRYCNSLRPRGRRKWSRPPRGIKLQFPRSPLIVPIHVVGFEMQVRHKLSRERRSFGKRLCFFVFVR